MLSFLHVRSILPVSRATGSLVQKTTCMLLGSTMLAALPVALPVADLAAGSAYAQQLFEEPNDPNAQMLLKADQLVYDNDSEIVTALGNTVGHPAHVQFRVIRAHHLFAVELHAGEDDVQIR